MISVPADPPTVMPAKIQAATASAAASMAQATRMRSRNGTDAIVSGRSCSARGLGSRRGRLALCGAGRPARQEQGDRSDGDPQQPEQHGEEDDREDRRNSGDEAEPAD